MSLLEHDTTKKKQMKELILLELDTGNSKEYKVEQIYNSEIHAKKLDSDYLLDLYYLVL